MFGIHTPWKMGVHPLFVVFVWTASLALAAICNVTSATKASVLLSRIILGVYVYYGHVYAGLWMLRKSVNNIIHIFSVCSALNFGTGTVLFVAIASSDNRVPLAITASAGVVISVIACYHVHGSMDRTRPKVPTIVSIQTGMVPAMRPVKNHEHIDCGMVPAMWAVEERPPTHPVSV